MIRDYIVVVLNLRNLTFNFDIFSDQITNLI